MTFKLFGTRVQISFWFAALITAMLLFDRTGLACPLLCSVFLHEIGHLFAMWGLGVAPKQIRLIPAAVEITVPPVMTARQEILVALSGPAVNLALFFAFFASAGHSQTAMTYAAINLLLALFHLLPVTGLDGGTVIGCLLNLKFGPNKARLITKIINLVFLAAAIVLAISECFRGNLNPTFWIVSFYLFVITFAKM